MRCFPIHIMLKRTCSRCEPPKKKTMSNEEGCNLNFALRCWPAVGGVPSWLSHPVYKIHVCVCIYVCECVWPEVRAVPSRLSPPVSQASPSGGQRAQYFYFFF